MPKQLKALLSTILFLFACSLCEQTARGQGQSLIPDCGPVSFNLTAAGAWPTGNGFANTFAGCDTWTVIYANTGFSGLTLTFQSAPLGTAPAAGNVNGTPGSWVTFAGTIPAGGGVNPNTSTAGAITQFSSGTANTTFVRVNLSGLTGAGNVVGVFYGYKTGYSGGTGLNGTTTCAATNDFLAGNGVLGGCVDTAGSGLTFGTLGTPSNGAAVACSDCTVTSGIDNTCKGTGTGALAVRLNGAWKCFI